MKRFKNKWDSIMIIFFYLSITHCFYLLPENIFVFPIGKMYDIALLISIIVLIIFTNGKVKLQTKESKLISRMYFIWLIYVFIGFVKALQIQSILAAIRGVRENFLFLIFLVIININGFNVQKITDYLLKLEIVGSLIYIFQFLISKPILFSGYLIQGVGGISVLRSYADIPVFKTFFVAFLLIGIIEKNYMYNQTKDYMCLLILLLAIMLHFQRSYYMCIFFVIALCILLSKMRFGLMKKILLLCIASLCIFWILPSIFPSIFLYINTAFSEYKDGGGNGLLRVDALTKSFDYLLNNGKVLLGLGSVSADMEILGLQGYVTSVRIIDMAYGTILVRYGVIGLIYYSLFWIICGIRALIKKTKFGKALFIFVISSLFLALTGESIIDYSIVLLGILMGMCLKVEEYMN